MPGAGGIPAGEPEKQGGGVRNFIDPVVRQIRLNDAGDQLVDVKRAEAEQQVTSRDRERIKIIALRFHGRFGARVIRRIGKQRENLCQEFPSCLCPAVSDHFVLCVAGKIRNHSFIRAEKKQVKSS